MTEQQAEHRFAGMDKEQNVPPLEGASPGPYRYRGKCLCGHVERWTTNQDWAWEEIANHYMPVIRNFVLHEQTRRTCSWCQYGRCADCQWLTSLAGGSACLCTHPRLNR